jgi:hypothetical protein
VLDTRSLPHLAPRTIDILKMDRFAIHYNIDTLTVLEPHYDVLGSPDVLVVLTPLEAVVVDRLHNDTSSAHVYGGRALIITPCNALHLPRTKSYKVIALMSLH